MTESLGYWVTRWLNHWPVMSHTGMYYHMLTLTDIYWHLLTIVDTYLQPIITWRPNSQNGFNNNNKKYSETKKRSCYERLKSTQNWADRKNVCKATFFFSSYFFFLNELVSIATKTPAITNRKLSLFYIIWCTTTPSFENWLN